MIDRFGRKAFALTACLVLALPGVAPAADLPAYKQPADETEITYDQAITCQAVYSVVASQFDEGSEDRTKYAAFYDAWYDFSSDLYPLDFAQHHDADVDAGADHLYDEWEFLTGDDLETAVDRELNTCAALEDSELILL